MKFRILHILICIGLGLMLRAQVDVNMAVILDGPAGRVQGLESTIAPEAAMNAETIQRNEALTIQGLGGNSWAIELPAFGGAPGNGAQVVVEVPTMSDAPVEIIFNGNGPYPLVREGVPVNGSQLMAGSLLSIVLADGSFHVLNGSHDLRRACPSGTVLVNEQYCIEPTEHGSGDYFQAGLACAASGLRLCTWAEFVVACGRTLELQLSGMTNSWEWTNNTSNEDNSGRIVGLNGCVSAGNWLSTGSGPIAYRCCYTR